MNNIFNDHSLCILVVAKSTNLRILSSMIMENIEGAYQQLKSLLESGDKQATLDFLRSESAKHNDAYLMFVYASELAQEQSYDLALDQFRKLVADFPSFHIGRFQFAFLLITTDNIEEALPHLSFLSEECSKSYLQLFSKGLLALVEDRIEESKEMLLSGISLNKENPSLNENIKKIIVDLEDAESSDANSDKSDVTEKAQSAMLDIYSKRF